jgi:hypothetical protein
MESASAAYELQSFLQITPKSRGGFMQGTGSGFIYDRD